MTIESTARGLIDELVRRIVDRFAPEKVILFGSHGRGEADPDSDVDLLVVMPFTGPRREKVIDVRMALRGVGIAKDVFLMTPEEFERRRDVVGTIAWPAAHEGTVLHERRE